MKTGNPQIVALSSAGADGTIDIGGALTGRIRAGFPAIVFWTSAVLLLFWSLGAKGLWGPEGRWAEVVREMQLTGDYFHPTINGRPYFDKPLLSYWLIALSAAVLGRLDESVVRLPSAIAGLLALAGVISLGRRLWSKSVARTAGWILLGSYGFIFWARTGEADMENMAAIILAVAWYWYRRDKPGFFSYVVFYLICFLGAHAKGMATIAVPILVILPDMIRDRRWRSHVSFTHFLALLAGLCVYLAPFAFSDMTRAGYPDSGLAFAIRENITRYFQPFDHKEPFYAYFYYLPTLFLPWLPLLFGASWFSFTRFRKLNWPGKWLVISTGLVFLFFTLSGSKRSYYILPILPFCALMVSLYVALERAKPLRRWVVGVQSLIFFVVLVAEILSPLIWLPVRKRVHFAPPRQLLLATSCLGGLALACFILARSRPARLAHILGAERDLAGPVAASVILLGGFFCWQNILLDTYRTERPFAMELKSRTESLGSGQIAFFRNFPTKTLFYMDLPGWAKLLKDADAARVFLSSTDQIRVLISDDDYCSELAAVLPGDMVGRPTLKEKVNPWEKREKYKAWIVRD